MQWCLLVRAPNRHGWLKAGQEGISKCAPSPVGGHRLQDTADGHTHLKACGGGCDHLGAPLRRTEDVGSHGQDHSLQQPQG